MALESENIPLVRAASDRNQPRNWPLWLFLGLVLAALVLPYTLVSNLIFCPFRLLTGIICPGCGMTRSVMSFVRGDLSSSLSFHFFGPILVTGMGALGILRLADRLRKREHFLGLRAWWSGHVGRISKILLATVLIYWAIRLATGAP